MTPKRHIGDPLERAATIGKIGGKQTANPTETTDSERPNAQTSESLEVQPSKSLNFQTSTFSDVQTPRNVEGQTSEPSGGQVSKRRVSQTSPHRGREQQTIYLSPHLIRKLKLHKALHDKEYSDIVAEALEEYFQVHQE
jgi:hypothetical protein